MQEEVNAKTVDELENEIWACETRLQQLRDHYMAKTGHMPLRKLNDSTWKWSVFMCLGFAFITMVVYLLGIRKTGEGLGIPDFFFNTEIAYFAILTFYGLLMILIVQHNKLSGLQSMSLLLGFWCAHWLIYDWGWWAYCYGVGEIPDLAVFWQSFFGQDLLIIDPPMWLFLMEAVLGGAMAFYTFAIPKRRRHLIPPFVWLYAAYINATILAAAGVDAMAILTVAIILVSISFGLMGLFSIQRLRQGLPEWLSNWRSPKGERKRGIRSWNPLGFPFIFILVGMLLGMHFFLTTNPTLGLFLGLIPWYLLPTYYIFVHSTGVMKRRRLIKVIVIGALSALFIAFVVLISILPIGTLI